jgi:hypothetical protein
LGRAKLLDQVPQAIRLRRQLRFHWKP